MKILLNILLWLVIGYMGYLLVDSIREPIAFGEFKDAREEVVIDRLKDIRKSQEIYRGITGQYAKSFDTLFYVLNNERIPILKQVGDPDDPNNLDKIRIDTIWINTMDSLGKLGISLDSLNFVPYTKGEQFMMRADTIVYQKTLVNVMEAGVMRGKFMGKYADPKYGKYDDSYEPNTMLKFGRMDSPNLSGNWE